MSAIRVLACAGVTLLVLGGRGVAAPPRPAPPPTVEEEPGPGLDEPSEEEDPGAPDANGGAGDDELPEPAKRRPIPPGLDEAPGTPVHPAAPLPSGPATPAGPAEPAAPL